MRIAPFYLVFTLFIFIQACGNKQVEENKTQREQVIAVHDEVMPKMGQLKSMEKAALQKFRYARSEKNWRSKKSRGPT